MTLSAIKASLYNTALDRITMLTIDTIKAIGDKHALGVPDRTRFNPIQRYVEDVAEVLLDQGGGELPADIEQRIERVVADRLADVYARLEAAEAELQRRKGGRPAKKDEANG